MKTSGLRITFLLICISLFSTQSFSQKTKLTDPEIASVAVTANQSDIDFAAVATERSKNADVLQFAKSMAADHQAIIDKAVALVTKLKVTPKDNPTSKSLKSSEEKTVKMLKATSEANFDKAYIDNEVSYHKAVISTVKNVLIPQAKNAELKELLESVMPTLEAHLKHAEMVQKDVMKKK